MLASGWLLHRTRSSIPPLALTFANLAEEIVLPSDAYGGEICAITVDGPPSTLLPLAIKKNLAALAGVRSIVLSRSGVSPGFANLHPLLRLFHRGQLVDEANFLWLGECRELRYVTCSGWPRFGSLDGIARASQLRSLRLTQCRKIRDLSPLAATRGLECLTITDCWEDIDGYERCFR